MFPCRGGAPGRERGRVVVAAEGAVLCMGRRRDKQRRRVVLDHKRTSEIQTRIICKSAWGPQIPLGK